MIGLLSTIAPLSEKNFSAARQSNALYSWSLVDDIHVVILGADDEPGRALVRKYNFDLVSEVLRAYDIGYFSQAPILSDMLERGLAATTEDWLALTNSDILLTPDFCSEVAGALDKLTHDRGEDIFITVRRRDYVFDGEIKSEAALRSLHQKKTRLHPLTGSDIFLAHRKRWEAILQLMPDYIFGKFSWDVFLHRYAVHECPLPVDASETVHCYHALHGSPVNRENPEVFHNLMIYEALYREERMWLMDERWMRI